MIGSLTSLWRYPFKSMLGEELASAELTERGLLGDRTYALVDGSDGKVASAKNPGKWPNLFFFRAAFLETPHGIGAAPPARITLPDGTVTTTSKGDANQVLSRARGREVTVATRERRATTVNAEEYWPDMEGLDHRDTVTDFALPDGTFFDCATVHLLTMATLEQLGALYPGGRFELRRFRPNLVVATAPDQKGFVENDWIGKTLRIGDRVRLNVTGPCPRCVMTTLAQGDLPKDPGILRTAAQHNHANVGVYASVARGGTVRRGDQLRFE